MAWDDKSNGKKKNPWGKQSNDDRGQWPPSGGGGHGGEPPDLDEILRKAQENFRSIMPGDFRGGRIVALVFAGILALWLSSGLFVVNPGEHAVIKRFGAWSRTQAEPGLGYHLPAPIESAEKVNVEEIRKMSIGFDEGMGRGANLGKRMIPEESLMLTSDRNIVDLNVVIQWNIKSAEEYLFEVRDQEHTIKTLAESAVREVVGQTDMFPIITTGRAILADRTKRIIQANLDQYKSGVNITQVLIEKGEVHPDVQGAFQDVQSAKQDAENVQNEAEAYREDILPKARGRAIQVLQEAEAYKQSTIARSNGDASRFNAVYEAYLSGKDVTKERIFIETMESVLKNANKVILDQQGNQGIVPYLPLNELGKKAPARQN
jgi:membrane protease subunit HflK